MAKLVERAIQDKVTLFHLLEGICSKTSQDLTPPVRAKIEQCVLLVKDMQRLVEQASTVLCMYSIEIS